MEIFNQIIHNKCLTVPIILWCVVQVSKLFLELIINKKINFKRLVGAGGMPSSHSATVTVLATLIGKYEGVDTSLFALSLIMAFISALVIIYTSFL